MKEYLVSNKKWPEDKLWEKRREILSWWPTGAEIDLEEAIEYHKNLPKRKIYAERYRKAIANNETPLIEPALGKASTEENMEHIKAISEAGADSAYLFTDSYTRKANYNRAQELLDEGRRIGKSLLNGYAVVCVGHREARRIVDESDIPVRLWDGADELPQLQVEIGLAAGFTAHGSEDLHDLYQHCKDYPLDKRIENNQYCCRLCGWYEEKGAQIDTQIPGNLSGYDVPDIKISLVILQALSTAEQGVKHITPAIFGVLHIIQDVAAVRVLRKLMREYLDKFGYNDVEFAVQHGSWQGNWPQDPYRSSAIVALDALKGKLSGADIVRSRSIAEGKGVTTAAESIVSIKVTKQMINMLKWQKMPESEELKVEQEMLELSVRAIVDKVIEMGDGDPVVGKIEASNAGVLDAAFMGWKYTYGKVIPVRDGVGAMRWFDSGNLPLPRVVKEYHQKKIAEREERLGKKIDLDIVVQDLFGVSIEDLSRVSLG